MTGALVMLIALGIEAFAGWPDKVHRRISHPVVWMGGLIDRLDRGWNQEDADWETRRAAGIRAALLVIGLSAGLAALALWVLPGGALGVALAGVLAWPFVAARSLHDHVAPVAGALEARDVDGAREAVSRIVGRDPSALDEAGLARAAMESLAENASDGVIAPLFWGALLGLPGIVAYKAINTLDSMIGHRDARHEAFGRFAARLDDVVNWVPARLTGVLFALASGRPETPLRVMRRDARNHRSPNAGWPESALAGALNIRLSGPRVYGSHIAHEPWLNAEAPDPGAADLRRALDLYRRMIWLTAACLALLWALTL
ncbi:adenosylcobinamide-phosphate synthase CbiB [Albimonas sp. CAU 1670]|uniref:adenosylcobinamide-phosphate synthase CbiB n=1 Tax=Albimonas sp. CAU 1670 TaxID=3032599 RepID=UPI0023DAAF20|nr:adenosylcobinamide-phosphate synthase CbiB [Albimonas sp. CAU 1670]MDF2234209.1 adenosylcobinamide-phosphate synthase CbiB [Albimonas sp. CAU 1670]